MHLLCDAITRRYVVHLLLLGQALARRYGDALLALWMELIVMQVMNERHAVHGFISARPGDGDLGEGAGRYGR